ncbi:MAG: protein kinase, partial [Gemmatimonadetes bacterium]|nr:protein kinase [Gemmatimonadota bacterium]
LKHQRRVAVKVLRPEFAASLATERFLREIQIAAKLQHPLIVPLYDSGAADGLLWYTMPYVEGEALRSRLKRERQLALDDALHIAREVAEALDYAHDHAVVHRDIKPENILLSGGHALVADFGVARAVSEAGGQLITSTGSALGTPAYMSPEQGTGDPGIDGRSDIYSLGCVLYELLVGEPPFTGPTPQAVIARHVSQPPPSLRVVRSGVPAGVEEVIHKALAKTPADRYRTATRFVEALERAGETTRRPGRVRWAVAASLMTAVVLAVAWIAVPRVFFGVALNPSVYVVASVLDPEGASAGTDYKAWEHGLRDALRQVPDVTVVESTRTYDGVMRLGGSPRDLEYWLEVARVLGAGRLVVPTVVEGAEAVQLVAEVYDVQGGRAVGRAAVESSRSLVQVAAAAARVAERLFGLRAGVLQTGVPRVEEATRAYVAGAKALERWDLETAEARFREASTLDPDYAGAHFSLAQVKAWAGHPVDQWLGAARTAVAQGAQLAGGREAGRARALVAIAERQFAQACALYDSL